MSINLRNEGCDACRALKDDERFTVFREMLGKVAFETMMSSLTAPPEARVDSTSYARALSDVWAAIEAAIAGVKVGQIDKQAMRKGSV